MHDFSDIPGPKCRDRLQDQAHFEAEWALGTMEDDRTTSAGLWRFSRDYAEAGTTITKAKGEKYFDPVYFLHARSIELAFKAFLRARGVPYQRLRFKPFGHDLEALLKECRRRRLGQFVKLTRQECVGVGLLNEQYASKRFEYIVTGTISVPKLFGLQRFNMQLVAGLRRYCIESTYGTRA